MPAVDFTTDIVIFLHVVVPADCLSLQLAAIETDAARRIVYRVYVAPPAPTPNCSEVGATHSFVVSVKRAVLPQGAFAVRISRELMSSDPREHPDEAEVPAVR